MTLDSRLATAAGGAAAAAAGLMLAQRIPGSIPAVALLAAVVVASGPAAVAKPRVLRRQTQFAPAWALAVTAACIRAGSGLVEDLAGAHAVAGLGLARGPVATVAGMWMGIVALTIAIAASYSEEPEGIEKRLSFLAWAAQVVLVVALFVGPQIRDIAQAVPWLVGVLVVGTWSALGRAAARAPMAPLVASALALGSLVLVVVGGRP